MAEALCDYIKNDRPFLGICLGLQLLFDSSEEKGSGIYFVSQFPALILYLVAAYIITHRNMILCV